LFFAEHVRTSSSISATGLDVTRPVLVVIDGAKALSGAVHELFDHPSSRSPLHQTRKDKSH